MNTKFYRGYIKLKEDKSPISRRMSRVIPKCDTVGGVFKPEYMMVDIDTFEDSDLFMQLVDKYEWKCHIVGSDSGIHAIFKKPDIALKSIKNTELMSGIKSDFKIGRSDYQNSDYECIIKHGKEREIIQYENDPQMLPWQLMPFTVEMDLKQIGEGDGRHSIHQQLIHRASAYCNDASEILDFVKWVNGSIFAVPRSSVNWKVSDVQDWLDDIKSEESLSLNEVLQQYDIKDTRKVLQFIRTNYSHKEDK